MGIIIKKIYQLGEYGADTSISRSLNQTNRNDIILSGSTIMGDTSINLDKIYFRASRVGNIIFLNCFMEISGFSVDIPNDSTMDLRLDIYKLGKELGIFSVYNSGAIGGASALEYIEGNGDDMPIGVAKILIDSSKLRLLNEEVYAPSTKTIEKLKLNFTTHFIGE